ncbi:Hypothetical_protein [Hexamita inflata]|uniref:Hypothetical_protein n=1 Tax=Hexamita inflata TaxID=28002 RepID=A0AA86TVH5_9EUKA|nr:Hypothetical protein HINF_LOCUS10833 [Hexamita inflata]
MFHQQLHRLNQLLLNQHINVTQQIYSLESYIQQQQDANKLDNIQSKLMKLINMAEQILSPAQRDSVRIQLSELLQSPEQTHLFSNGNVKPEIQYNDQLSRNLLSANIIKPEQPIPQIKSSYRDQIQQEQYNNTLDQIFDVKFKQFQLMCQQQLQLAIEQQKQNLRPIYQFENKMNTIDQKINELNEKITFKNNVNQDHIVPVINKLVEKQENDLQMVTNLIISLNQQLIKFETDNEKLIQNQAKLEHFIKNSVHQEEQKDILTKQYIDLIQGKQEKNEKELTNIQKFVKQLAEQTQIDKKENNAYAQELVSQSQENMFQLLEEELNDMDKSIQEVKEGCQSEINKLKDQTTNKFDVVMTEIEVLTKKQIDESKYNKTEMQQLEEKMIQDIKNEEDSRINEQNKIQIHLSQHDTIIQNTSQKLEEVQEHGLKSSASLQELAKQIDAEKSNQHATNDKVDSELEQLNAKHTALQAEVKQVQSSLGEQIQSTVQSVKAVNEAVDKNQKEAELKIAENADYSKKLSETVEQAKIAIDLIQQSAKLTNEQVNTHFGEIKQLNEYRQITDTWKENSEKQKESLNGKIEQCAAQISDLKAKHEQDVVQINAKIAEVELQHNNFVTIVDQTTNKVGDTLKQIQAHADQVDETTKSQLSLIETLDQTQQQHKQALDTLTTDVQDKHADNINTFEKLNKQISKHSLEISELITQKDVLLHQDEQLRNSLNEHTKLSATQFDSVKETVQTLKAEDENIKTHILQVKSQCAVTNDNLAQQTERITKSENIISNNEQTSQKILQSIQLNLEDTHKQHQELKTQVEANDAVLKSTSHKLDQVDKSLCSTQEQLSQSESVLKQQVENLSVLTQDFKSSSETTQQSLAQKQKQLDELVSEGETATKRFSGLDDTLQKQSGDISRIQKEQSNVDQTIKQMQGQQSDIAAKLEATHTKLEEVQEHGLKSSASLQELAKQIDTEKSNQHDTNDKVGSELEQLNAKHTALQAEVKQVQSSLGEQIHQWSRFGVAQNQRLIK